MKVIETNEIASANMPDWEELNRAIEIADGLSPDQAILIQTEDVKMNGEDCETGKFRTALRKKIVNKFGRDVFKIRTKQGKIVITRNNENDS